MNDFARLPADERRVYFEQAAAQLGRLTPQLIEKDFWVCWLLQRVFALDDLGPHLTFKGGTSLSKAYQIIERFSEDVDLAIERDYLGFGADNDPEQGRSGKERQRRIASLRSKCQTVIAEQMLPALSEVIANHLRSSDWKLTLADVDDDPDQQSIRFQFPPSLSGGLNAYFAPSVKLELGARSDHFPVESLPIRPYLADAFSRLLSQSDTTVRVLHVERTFWEKATILHALAHRPLDKPLPKAQSRHYYDLFQLANHPRCSDAPNRLNLLARVAEHKSVFFSSAQARYDEARPGTLRLIPGQQRLAEVERDYRSMAPMFFGAIPKFDEIVNCLNDLEQAINGPSA